MAGRHKEGILHVAGRVVGREVEGLEDVIVVFYLGPLCNVVTELAEYIDNLLTYNAYRMAGASVLGSV